MRHVEGSGWRTAEAGYGGWERVQVLSPASVAAATTAEETFTVVGVLSTDRVSFVTKPTVSAGVGIVGQRASADSQIGIGFVNTDTTAIVPTSEESYVFGFRTR